MTNNTLETESNSTHVAAPKRFRVGGLLPFIGIGLFAAATVNQFAGGAESNWGPTLVANAVTYLIGWAMVGAGISHVFFGKKISQTIGFKPSPFELEVGFAGIAMGVTALLASSFSPEFSLAIIIASSIFRVGCGFGHIVSMVRDRNFAVNNTAILVINFVVPAFLLVAYAMWA